MTQHINDKTLQLTGNGTTHVEATYPVTTDWNKDGVSIYNSSTTVVLFVKSGASTVVADTTCNIVPPNTAKRFKRLPTDTTLSIVYQAASTSIVYVTPESPFEGLQ